MIGGHGSADIRTASDAMGRLGARAAAAALSALAICAFAEPAHAQAVSYTFPLNDGDTGTFLTGIRGNNIVGNYVIPGGNTAGFLYSLSAGTFSPFPEGDGGANYPGAISASPYGPSVGNPNGILRTVGSYKTTASSPYDLSFLYDGAAAPGSQLTTLAYPSSGGDQTLFTIAHSTFGEQVVGNYDTRLVTGNAFLYTISTGAYATINRPGAVSTTAYGVWGDKIAGGFALSRGSGAPQQGFIYDESTNTWTNYNHPGAVSTHFEGISGGGRANTYNLVADWLDARLTEHASVLHIAADGTLTWIDLDVPGGSVTSANSIYGNQAIGVYTANGVSNGYIATIAGIYNPISNSAALNVNTPGVPVLTGTQGDDILNNGSITTNGANNSALQSDTYGVVTNNGTLAVNGAGSAGVDLNGNYGTLLNNGTIRAAAGAYAIRSGAGATGTAVVNTGIIDGQIAMTAGTGVRFENSGWLGISAAGAGTTHAIAGVFAQTDAGTLALRLSSTANDALQVTGPARLAGTLQLDFQALDSVRRSYTIVSATQGVTGTFGAITSNLVNFSGTASYAAADVVLDTTATLGANDGLSGNQQSVADSLNNAFNSGAPLPSNLLAIFNLTGSSLATALDQLSGEAAADSKQGSFQMMTGFLGLMRDRAVEGRSGGLGSGAPGIATAQLASLPSAVEQTYAAVLDALEPPPDRRWSVWGSSFGGSNATEGNAATGSHDVSAHDYGFATGLDYRLSPDTLLGFALAEGSTDWGLSQGLGGGRGDALEAGIYGAARSGPAYLSGSLAFAYHWMTTDRYAYASDHLKASFDAQSYGGRLEAGYRFPVRSSLGATPYAALQEQAFHTPSYSETGLTGGGYALSYEAKTATDTRSELGARLDDKVALGGKPVDLRARVAWAHDWSSDPSMTATFQALPGASFVVEGAPLASDSALVSAGAELHISASWSVDVKFDGEFAAGSHTYAGTGTLRYVW